jgi:hypothetical protein
MQEPSSDPEQGTVEYLDPDPPRRPSAAARGELLLGGLLLVIVLAWTGWQWWHDQSLAAEYRSGQQAAARQDWAAALQHYRAAGDYDGAAAQAGKMQVIVAELDAQYSAATEALERGEGIAALQALDAIGRITPGYGNTRSMYVQAQEEIYTAAFSGTVLLRPDATPPGLYLRMTDRWLSLQGSDLWSTVQATCPAAPACVVYDVPAPSWEPPAGGVTGQDPRTETGAAATASDLRGRQLIALTFAGGQPHFIRLDLDTDLYGAFVAGAHGVWGLRPHVSSVNEGLASDDLSQRMQGAWPNFDLVYQEFGSGVVQPVRLPGPNGTVVALSAGGDRMLVAERMPGVAGRTVSNLYLCGPDGSAPRLLFTQDGGFINAQLSPAGDYTLLHTYTALGAGSERHAIILLRLDPQAVPRILATGTATRPTVSVGATFIADGVFAGHALVATWGDSSRISLFNPAVPDKALISTEVAGQPRFNAYATAQGSGGGVIIVWQNDQGRGGDSITVLHIDPARRLATGQAALPIGESLWDIAIRGHRLIYTTLALGSPARGRSLLTVRSIALPGVAPAAPQSVRLYSQEIPLSNTTFGLSVPWSLGPGLLAYSRAQGLQAATYDDPNGLDLGAIGSIVASLETPVHTSQLR